jgi:acyl carrier protein
MTDTQATIFDIIANILGVEPSDITPSSDFLLDLNATPDDMNKIKTEIESSLDVMLPEFDEETSPIIVSDLLELVEDSLL